MFSSIRYTIVGLFAVLSCSCKNGPETKELSPFVLPADDAAFSIQLTLPGDPNFLTKHLADFGLTPLSANSAINEIDSYRFLWTRSFHKAALFEMQLASEGNGFFKASIWEGTGAHGHWVIKRSIPFEKGNVENYRRWVTRGKFFDLPFYDNRQGFDGAGWLFEIRQAGKYHAVYRWSPEDGFIREFGRYLIETSLEKSDFLPIY